MNRIYKVVWNRCLNAFVVVSEIARSHSGKSSTQHYNPVKGQQTPSALTKIVGGMALAFGLSGMAGAQVNITDAKPGESVHDITPGDSDVELVNAIVTNTAYGNALKVGTGAGGVARVSGGTFTINPTAPNDDRGIDTAPYAGIWIETVSDEFVYLQDAVQISVTGEELYGIHLAESHSWLSSSGTTITAKGKRAVGVFTQGTASLRGDTITVDGDYAAGIVARSSEMSLADSVIDVDGFFHRIARQHLYRRG